MLFIVMGCGRVGAAIANTLHDLQHDVAVIDRDADAFRRLGVNFDGRTVEGVGFDKDTLIEAGIEHATAFAAVSSGDNSNILAARVARETFGVTNVVARIYDPRRAEVYQRMGIPTVATVRWAADQTLSRMLPDVTTLEYKDASSQLCLIQTYLPPHWAGNTVADLELATSARVAFISRLGVGTMISAESILQEGDSVHLMIRKVERDQIENIISKPVRNTQRGVR